MKTKFSLLILCSMVVFSCNTRAAQESDPAVVVTIENKEKYSVYVCTNFHKSADGINVGFWTDIIGPSEKKEFRVEGNSMGHMPVIVAGMEKEYTLIEVRNEEGSALKEGENKFMFTDELGEVAEGE